MKKCKVFLSLIFLFCCNFLISVNAQEDNYTHYHIVDIDDPISFEEIKSRYKAYDALDGYITENLCFTSDYEADYLNNKLSLKDYSLQVSVINSRGNQSSWVDIISLRDFTAPVVEVLQEEVTIDIFKENLLESLLHCFHISDSSKNLQYDWQGIDEANQEGDYLIHLVVIDEFQNTSEAKGILVHIIESTNRYILKSPIEIKDMNLTKAELIEMFLNMTTISNPYQSITVSSNYFDSPQKNGTYQITFEILYEDESTEIYQGKILNEITKDKKNKNNAILYISLGIISFLSVLGIIIYRKRR